MVKIKKVVISIKKYKFKIHKNFQFKLANCLIFKI